MKYGCRRTGRTSGARGHVDAFPATIAAKLALARYRHGGYIVGNLEYMAAEMVPWTGSVPRRARHLIPTGLPRRRETVAGCAVAILVAHLLLAQLTLVLAVLFAVVSKASRWRLWWLLAPAAAGLAWTLATGPDQALAGFAAGPSAILWHLGGGHLAGAAGHPFAGFADAGDWLPRQFPVALIGGAAEAALAGWLAWLHTDEWAVPPPRPGLLAAARRELNANAIRAGAVVTRDGCALGVVPSTGAIAELRWADLTAGTLVVGAAPRDVTLTGLQVVHAALRRRKPVIVFDLGDAATARAVAAACRATGVPLLPDRTPDLAGRRDPVGQGTAAGQAVQVAGAAAASRLWGRGPSPEPASPAALAGSPDDRPEPDDRPAVDLGRVVRDRLAVLLPADSPGSAARACADLVSLAADLHRIGVDGDALVWVPGGERVPAQAIAPLLRAAPQAGLSVLIGTTSPAAATDLSGLTSTMLIFRVADRDLAARLANRAGTRLLPASAAAALNSRGGPGSLSSAGRPGSLSGLSVLGSLSGADSQVGPAGSADSAGQPAGAAPQSAVPVPDLVPCPVIPAAALLALGEAEFAATASSPRRLIASARLVPARLPEMTRGTGRRAGMTR